MSREAVTRGVRVKIGSPTCFLCARPLATATRLGFASGFPSKCNAFLRRSIMRETPPRLACLAAIIHPLPPERMA